MDLCVILLEAVDGKTGVPVAYQQVAHIGDDSSFFVIEMTLQFGPVIGEKAVDDLFLGWRAGLDQVFQRFGQIDQRTVDIVVVRLIQIVQDVLDPAGAQHFHRRKSADA